jgi:threonine synthase
VPTGNFGDIFAGCVAHAMGLPIDRLVLATNENDILRRFFETGEYRRGPVHATLSPSMDIQVASNFERFLYYRLGGDSARLRRFMAEFARTGCARLEAAPVSELLVAGSADRKATLETIRRYHREHGYLLDPHSAVGVSVAEGLRADSPVVCFATAHPAKFPEAIEAALGEPLGRHPAVDALAGLPTRREVLPAAVDRVKAVIEAACGS